MDPRRLFRRTVSPGLAVLAAAALTLTGLAGSAEAAGVNVAKNAGFESGLANWTCSAGSGTTVTSPMHSGASALQATPAGQDNAKCSQTVAVKPNSTYALSAWVQGSYVYLSASGTGTTDVSTWTPRGGSSWIRLSTTFTTGASTTSVTVYTHGWYGQPAYFADDLSVFGPDGGGGPDPDPVVPAAPVGLAAGAVTASSLSLSWSPASGVTGYNVYRGSTKVQAVTGTSATVTGLAASTSYTFQVTATNSAGESAKSTAVTATTANDGRTTNPNVPKHALTGYWQNFNNGATVQKLRDVQSQFDIIAVSFADSTATTGEITFNLDPAVGYASAPDFKADIAARKSAGRPSSTCSTTTAFRCSAATARSLPRARWTASPHSPAYSSRNGLDLSQVGLGPTQGAGSGYVAPSIVKNALDCLARGTNCGAFRPARTYPSLRGAMTWSTNRDAAADDT
ncbi:hypothetical protein QFZ67_000071 [Streptomyces sp. V1I1]|nr:hypothetical protein [Streptomyces sp. V1I1]